MFGSEWGGSSTRGIGQAAPKSSSGALAGCQCAAAFRAFRSCCMQLFAGLLPPFLRGLAVLQCLENLRRVGPLVAFRQCPVFRFTDFLRRYPRELMRAGRCENLAFVDLHLDKTLAVIRNDDFVGMLVLVARSFFFMAMMNNKDLRKARLKVLFEKRCHRNLAQLLNITTSRLSCAQFLLLVFEGKIWTEWRLNS